LPQVTEAIRHPKPGFRLTFKDAIMIGSMLVMLALAWARMEYQIEHKAKTVAQEEIRNALDKDLPMIKYRLGQIEDTIGKIWEKLEDITPIPEHPHP